MVLVVVMPEILLLAAAFLWSFNNICNLRCKSFSPPLLESASSSSSLLSLVGNTLGICFHGALPTLFTCPRPRRLGVDDRIGGGGELGGGQGLRLRFKELCEPNLPRSLLAGEDRGDADAIIPPRPPDWTMDVLDKGAGLGELPTPHPKDPFLPRGRWDPNRTNLHWIFEWDWNPFISLSLSICSNGYNLRVSISDSVIFYCLE